jgi:hypothetical protein
MSSAARLHTIYDHIYGKQAAVKDFGLLTAIAEPKVKVKAVKVFLLGDNDRRLKSK